MGHYAGPALVAQVILLEGVRLHSLWNRLRKGGPRLAVGLAAALALLLLFLYGEYRFFLQVFVKLGELPNMPRFLLIGVVERLHDMIFMTAFSMLLISNLLTSVSTAYMAADLPLLHSSPLRRGAIFAAKLLEALVLSSYMVWLVTMPLFIAFGRAYGSAPRTALWSLVVLLLYALPPAALGSLAALVLMRFVPARRAHQVLTGLAVLAGVVLVTLLRMMRPERLLNPEHAEDLVKLLGSIAPTASFLPSTWASTAVVSSIQGLRDVFAHEVLKLTLLAAMLLLPLSAAATAGYFRAYSRSGEGLPASGAARRRSVFDRMLAVLLSPASRQARALSQKDARVFVRDSVQWSQLFLIAALVFVYLFNIKNLPAVEEFPYLRIFVGYLNLGLTGFILAAISVRYAFPAVSLEGAAFWVIRSAPVDYRRFLYSKLMLHFVPFGLLAETLVVLAVALLAWDPYLLITSVYATAGMTFGLTGLGVGLGAMLPRFRFESATQIAAGVGGVTYMVLALLFITLVLGVLFVPTQQHLVAHFPSFDVIRMRTVAAWPFHVGLVALCAAVGVVPMELGLARLRMPRD
ncbi:MAG: hypothetical protein U0166_27330 [Acidobacteriota bacterium]